MVACLRAMGVGIADVSPSELAISGVGLDGLRAPADALDCGDSETTLHLLCGVLAGQPFGATLTGDATLSQRSMERVAAALRARGAVLTGRSRPRPDRDGDLTAPLAVGPRADGSRLAALEYESPVASSGIKSALLLSGLYADGITLFKEPTVSPDHTERMLGARGVPIRTVGPLVQIDPAGWGREMPAFELAVPGDFSSAALLVVAAQIVDGSRVTIRGVGTNPTRTGLLEIARDMGAGLAIEPHGERGHEPVADLHAWCAPLRGVAVGGETVLRGIDEIPIACALAARAKGTTRISSSDDPDPRRTGALAATAGLLRAFGVPCHERPEGLAIDGRETPLEPAAIDSRGSARMAMAATVLGLVGRGPTRVRDAGCIARSYPKFVATLRALGARIDVEV